jgi:hypothetical protein
MRCLRPAPLGSANAARARCGSIASVDHALASPVLPPAVHDRIRESRNGDQHQKDDDQRSSGPRANGRVAYLDLRDLLAGQHRALQTVFDSHPIRR